MVEAERKKLLVWHGIAGDLRFLGHKDTMRMWQRLLARSGAPVKFSEGFNPHPRMSLPLPRSVGVAGTNELLVAEVTGEVDAAGLAEWLAGAAPVGLAINGVEVREREWAAAAEWAVYRAELGEGVDREQLAGRVAEFMGAGQWQVERERRGRHPGRAIDVRGSVAQMRVVEGGLEWKVLIRQEGTVRVEEVLACVGLTLEQVREVVRVEANFRFWIKKDF